MLRDYSGICSYESRKASKAAGAMVGVSASLKAEVIPAVPNSLTAQTVC